MELRCCIIEDEVVYIKQLKNLLVKWQIENNCPLLIENVCSEKEFFEKNFKQYNIIFIDILLDNITTKYNGITIAKKIRSNNYTGEFVFITNFQNFVFEGYTVHALDYILKPISYEKINNCLNQVLEKIVFQNFIYQFKNIYLQIPYQDILYFSSNNHSTNLIAAQKQYQIPRALKDIFKLLPFQFSQCHRTIIVNLDNIETMTSKEILLTNQEHIPIGQRYVKSLQTDFINLIKRRRLL